MSVRVDAPIVTGAEERTVAVWQQRVRMRVVTKGRGPALVFFHGPWGLTWDPFLDALAESFTVVAPEHPGTTPDAHDDIYHLDGLWDLVLCYDELFETLGIDSAAFVGHSFGGMIACEMAAAYPDRVRRLAMIAPLGFWRDPDHIVNWMMLEPAALRAHIFRVLMAGRRAACSRRPMRRTPRRRRRACGSCGRWARPGSSSGRSPTRA